MKHQIVMTIGERVRLTNIALLVIVVVRINPAIVVTVVVRLKLVVP